MNLSVVCLSFYFYSREVLFIILVTWLSSASRENSDMGWLKRGGEGGSSQKGEVVLGVLCLRDGRGWLGGGEESRDVSICINKN